MLYLKFHVIDQTLKLLRVNFLIEEKFIFIHTYSNGSLKIYLI